MKDTENTINKNDLRYQRTDRMIKDAYITLLMEKNLEAINVKAICEKATVSRRAFYSHFDSVDDLLLAIQSDLSVQFFDEVKGFDHIEHIDQLVQCFFDFADKHGMIFEKINYDLNLDYLRKQIVNQVADMSSDNFKALKGTDKYTRNMVYRFMNASCVGMYRQWIRDGRAIPKEKAVKMTADLIGSGVKSLLN